MAKAIGVILAVVQIGIGIATGNVGLIVAGTIALIGSTVALLSTPGAAKPETTEQSIKTERPPRVRGYGASRLYGASACYETVGGTTVDVWAFHDGPANAIRRTYLNDDLATVTGGTVQQGTDKRYQGGKVKAGWSLGRPVETAFAAVTAVLPAWDASHRGDGVVMGYLLKQPETDKKFLETYPQGDQVAMSLVGEWTPTFDPRDPQQSAYDPSTWTWSENAVRAFIHYLMVDRGYDWNTRLAPQTDKIIAAINDADVQMPLASGDTEARYRTALSYKATEEPGRVITSLLACFDGWYCINEAGEVVVYSGRFYAPTVTIGPDVVAAYRHQSGVEDENEVNEIAIPYVSDLHDYNTVDAQPWRDEDSITKRGRVNTKELGAVIPSFTQGRRLAKRQMARNNAGDRGTVTTTWAGRAVLSERYIRLVLEEAGATFFDGVAEVTAAERDQSTGGVTFEWVAADPNIDAWNPATEDGEGAPVGNRYAPAPLGTPIITAASVSNERDDAFAGGGYGTRVTLTVTSPDQSASTWYYRWRTSDSAPWVEEETIDLDGTAGVTLMTQTVPQVDALQLQVECRTPDGRLSPWSVSRVVKTN